MFIKKHGLVSRKGHISGERSGNRLCLIITGIIIMLPDRWPYIHVWGIKPEGCFNERFYM